MGLKKFGRYAGQIALQAGAAGLDVYTNKWKRDIDDKRQLKKEKERADRLDARQAKEKETADAKQAKEKAIENLKNKLSGNRASLDELKTLKIQIDSDPNTKNDPVIKSLFAQNRERALKGEEVKIRAGQSRITEMDETEDAFGQKETGISPPDQMTKIEEEASVRATREMVENMDLDPETRFGSFMSRASNESAEDVMGLRKRGKALGKEIKDQATELGRDRNHIKSLFEKTRELARKTSPANAEKFLHNGLQRYSDQNIHPELVELIDSERSLYNLTSQGDEEIFRYQDIQNYISKVDAEIQLKNEIYNPSTTISALVGIGLLTLPDLKNEDLMKFVGKLTNVEASNHRRLRAAVKADMYREYDRLLNLKNRSPSADEKFESLMRDLARSQTENVSTNKFSPEVAQGIMEVGGSLESEAQIPEAVQRVINTLPFGEDIKNKLIDVSSFIGPPSADDVGREIHASGDEQWAKAISEIRNFLSVGLLSKKMSSDQGNNNTNDTGLSFLDESPQAQPVALEPEPLQPVEEETQSWIERAKKKPISISGAVRGGAEAVVRASERVGGNVAGMVNTGQFGKEEDKVSQAQYGKR